jgi:hypothetical protein
VAIAWLFGTAPGSPISGCDPPHPREHCRSHADAQSVAAHKCPHLIASRKLNGRAEVRRRVTRTRRGSQARPLRPGARLRRRSRAHNLPPLRAAPTARATSRHGRRAHRGARESPGAGGRHVVSLPTSLTRSATVFDRALESTRISPSIWVSAKARYADSSISEEPRSSMPATGHCVAVILVARYRSLNRVPIPHKNLSHAFECVLPAMSVRCPGWLGHTSKLHSCGSTALLMFGHFRCDVTPPQHARESEARNAPPLARIEDLRATLTQHTTTPNTRARAALRVPPPETVKPSHSTQNWRRM